jgi:RimJ/RimL family protein N-acetyltransferase
VPEHQRQGLATEAVEALLELAMADPTVQVIVATTYATLHASVRVFQKPGFVEVSRAPMTGLMRFEDRR